MPGHIIARFVTGTSARGTSAREDKCQGDKCQGGQVPGGQVPGHGTCPTGTCQGVTCLLTFVGSAFDFLEKVFFLKHPCEQLQLLI